MKLFEGIKVTKSILDKVLKESDDIQMGFECEFNMPYDMSMSEMETEINVFGEEDYQDVKKYFTIEGPELDPQVLRDYIIDNAEHIADNAGFDESETQDDFVSKKFSEKHWYRDYLDEHGMWDYEGNKPTTEGNVPGEDEVKQIITDDLISDTEGLDGEFYSDHLNNARQEFIAEFYSDEDIAQEMYTNDPSHFFDENGWELLPGWDWADETMGTIALQGAEFMPVIDSFDQRFMTQLFPIDYHAEAKENDTWYIEPDSSLGEFGAEVSSAVYPLMECLPIMEQFFEFMQEEELETDESTGLHVSLSFINNNEVDIDWVKLALLMGEEHTLKQFDRVGNTYTSSQIDSIEKHIKKADLTKLKDWSGFKALTDMAVESLQNKDRTFNIQDFYNEGRVEFRIMGNTGYETRYEEIRYHILRFVMVMKIASDENLFKKEYMKKFGALMLRAKEDALNPHEGDVSSDIADNKYFKMAKQVFRGRKDIAKSVARFIQAMLDDDRAEGISYIVSLAGVVSNDNFNEYRKLLLESTKSEKLSSAKRSLLRKMAAEYGLSKEDFEGHFGKSIDDAFDSYVPVADEVNGGNVLATTAYQLLAPTDEQEAQINRKRSWFVKRIPVLRKANPVLRGMMLKAIAPTLSMFDNDRGSKLADTFQYMVKNAAKKHPRNVRIRNLLMEILEFRGQEWDEINFNSLKPQELHYLGIDAADMEDDEELKQEDLIEKYMERYSSVLKRDANVDPATLQTMFQHLLFGDKSTGENILLKILYTFREFYKDGEGGYVEPDNSVAVFKALMELALKFRPGTNIKNNTFAATLPIVQEWYDNFWL